jgi:hypothetical protein
MVFIRVGNGLKPVAETLSQSFLGLLYEKRTTFPLPSSSLLPPPLIFPAAALAAEQCLVRQKDFQ